VLAVLLQFGEKNPGMTRVMVGDALVFENDRLTARMNQFFERIESQLRQSLRQRAEVTGSTTPTVDANAQASVLTGVRDRTPAALRALGIQEEPDRAPRRRAAPVRGVTTIAVGGQPLTLLPEKAAFVPASRTLLVADAHIGKAVTFRALGVPVPRGTTSETLAALSALVATWRARRVVFLGDFLHSARAHAAATIGAVARWRRGHASLDLVLVRGNHDSRAGDPPAHLGIEVVDEPYLQDGFALCHHPRRSVAATSSPAICIRASASAGAASTTCDCRASGSATTSACCRRSAPSPACIRSGRKRTTASSRSPAAPSRRCSRAHPRWRPSGAPPESAMAFDPASLARLVARAEALVDRLEAVLPHPLTRPTGAPRRRFATAAAAPAAASIRSATSRRSGSRRSSRSTRRRKSSSATPSSSSPARAPTTCF
jgi:DNA ligase-associated metallophosphoesterase